MPANNGLLLQQPCFLKYVREVTKKYDCLLIFDEVISGFRVGFEGAAGLYEIQPDIITFGKIIGGGMPVGAYGGSHDIMHHVAPDGPVYQAGTLSANPITMTAGLAALEIALEDGFYNDLEKKTHAFVTQINNALIAAKMPARMIHMGSIFWLQWTTDRIIRPDQIPDHSNGFFRSLHHILLHQGIYLGPSGYEVGFISGAHNAQLLSEAADKISNAIINVLS